MKQQNYKNHSQIVLSYHGITLLALIALLVGSVVNLVKSSHDNVYSASLLVLVALILTSLYYHTRTFALKAQDRAIRAEVGLRYFILTGKALDSRLRLSQIIALRFASDEELTGLAQRAVEEGLSNKEIKQQIKHWKGDWHRV